MANENKMNIIEALVQLRNDLKLWVTNNLRVKMDKNLGAENSGKILSVGENGDIAAIDNHVVVDDTLSTESTNPVQNKVINAAINDAKEDASNKDAAILFEAQKGINEAKEDASNKDAAVLFEAQKSINDLKTYVDVELAKKASIQVIRNITPWVQISGSSETYNVISAIDSGGVIDNYGVVTIVMTTQEGMVHDMNFTWEDEITANKIVSRVVVYDAYGIIRDEQDENAGDGAVGVSLGTYSNGWNFTGNQLTILMFYDGSIIP